eukprot:comp20716_c0_seq1/m.27046 comp20716_c0_seq1/g.27046  ORF comp20716_c0_seq1/g.27046 comp20716_c0_seq1/m.27046 type:complete len:659 (-) comp20716_c0_seq1:289-2265(-)
MAEADALPPTPAQLAEVKAVVVQLYEATLTVDEAEKQIAAAVSGWGCSLVDRTAAVDHVYVMTLRGYLKSEGENLPVENVRRLVDGVIKCSQEGLCTSATCCTMLAPLFDTLPIDCCEKFFSLLEDHHAVFSQNKDYTYVLTIGNSIMGRLSRAQHHSLNARVLMWMARVFPTFHNSGTRQQVPQKDANKTIFTDDQEEKKEEGTGADVPLEEALGGAGHLDVAFCRTFWHLQDFMQNAGLVNTKQDELVKCMDTVLDCFESNKIVAKPRAQRERAVTATEQQAVASPAPSRKREAEEVEEGQITKKAKGEDELEETQADDKGDTMDLDDPTSGPMFVFPKYLTSRRALRLQLADPQFRLSILLEMLVFVQAHTHYWRGRPSTNKNKTPPPGLVEYLNKVQPRICRAIEALPNGANTLAIFKHLLNHELRWIEWKNENAWDTEEGIPPMVEDNETRLRGDRAVPRPAPTLEKDEAASERTKRTVWKPKAQRHQAPPRPKPTTLSAVGSCFIAPMKAALDRDPTDLSALKTKPLVPTFTDYFEEALEQLNPDSGVDREYFLTQRPDWVWSALRLLASTKLTLLYKMGADKTLEQVLDAYRQEEEKKNATQAGTPTPAESVAETTASQADAESQGGVPQIDVSAASSPAPPADQNTAMQT